MTNHWPIPASFSVVPTVPIEAKLDTAMCVIPSRKGPSRLDRPYVAQKRCDFERTLFPPGFPRLLTNRSVLLPGANSVP